MGWISSLFGYVLNFLYEIVNNYGLAIIIFSVLLRIILLPITIKQQKTMVKSSKMQAELKKIQIKYKNNPEKLNQETMDLYKRENMSPFSGCLSSILQLIIILSVFWLVSQPLTYMKNVNTETINEYKEQIAVENEGKSSSYPEIAIINKIETEYNQIEEQLVDENVENKEELENKKIELSKYRINMEFLGLDLSMVPTQSLNDWRVYVIPGLYVITSFISIKLTTKQQNDMNKKRKEESEAGDNPQDDMMDATAQMSKSMNYMMPIMSITIAAIAPLGLALYWLVSNILMIIERLILNKVFNKEEETAHE